MNMEIIINKKMEALLKKLEKYKSPKKNINIELNKLFYDIYPEIIVWEDIIMRKEHSKKYNEEQEINREYIIKEYGTVSGFEDFWNHIHIFDIIDCSVMQTLKFGIILKEILKDKLKREFPKNQFIIVLCCDGKDKINTIIRFHKYRKNETLYNQKFIDGYCDVGFLVEKI